MSRVQEFYDRVEAEHNSFITDLETADVDDILKSAKNIMMHQEVYNYFIKFEPICEDKFSEFMDEEKPIQAICERYNPSQEELHEEIETIIDSIISSHEQEQGGMDLC